jgi:energy-coupling factor transporter ATP-binding protein EcfA2
MDRPRAIFLQKRIHDWSTTLPVWQSALLRKLSQGPLTDGARDALLDFLLGERRAVTPRRLELSDLPADETEHGVVELREIRALRNINRLAGGQTLRFGPGLNIVFGENGTGKSGYGRLCRRLCRAAEPGEVLRDVFEPGASEQPQTAELVLSVDGTDRVVEVDLGDDPPRILSAMTAFDASCARVYLSKANTIDHTPRSLRLLKEMAGAQGEMTEALEARIAEREAALPDLPTVAAGTVTADLVRRVAEGLASPDEVRALAARTADERAELEELEGAEAAIRADQTTALEARARAKATAVQDLIDTIERAWSRLDDDALRQLEQLRSATAVAARAAEQLAHDAFADQRMTGTGGPAWRLMWDAARRFVESSGERFPDSPVCPVCQQDLDHAAQARMKRFEAFVVSDLQRRADQADAELARRLGALPDVAAIELTTRATLAGESEGTVAVATRACAALAGRRSIAMAAPDPPLSEPLDLADLHAFVAEMTAGADRHRGLRDEREQRRVRDRLAELRANAAVGERSDDLHTRLTEQEAIGAWRERGKELSTRRISTKIGELSKLAITDRLFQALEQEIADLDPVADRVELKGSASKGNPAVQFRLRSDGHGKVTTVLSTGEQTALATAFFLADLAVSEERSAIILDDPVSSLDHQRREQVAARLVEEAKRRQVVVFTHDLTFVYLLQEAFEQSSDGEARGQTLSRAYHRVGVVRDELPWMVLAPAARARQLRGRLKSELKPLFRRQDPRYEDAAGAWMIDLRKAYDQLIEDYVLAGVVRRSSQHVRVRQLHDVTWSRDIVARVDAGMKRLSSKAHHEALERYPTPAHPDTLEELLAEYDELRQITKPTKLKDEAPGEHEATDAA